MLTNNELCPKVPFTENVPEKVLLSTGEYCFVVVVVVVPYRPKTGVAANQ